MDFLSDVINTKLVDLSTQSPDFAGIFTPEIEFNQPKKGVTDLFLEGAENYFERFERFDFTNGNLKLAFDHIGISPKGVLLDLGAGFGNSTIPLLRNYPDIKIVASDISPNLLAILKKLTEKYGVSDRCSLISCDLLNDYFKPSSVDMVLGVAILHHLVDPVTLIRSSLKSLKPGGYAIFMEPFAEGHFVLRSIFEAIILRYEDKKLKKWYKPSEIHDKGIAFLKAVNLDIFARTLRTDYKEFQKLWPNLDDKWLFTRSYFHKIAKKFDDISVDFINLHTSPEPFLSQMRYLLGGLAGLPCPDCLPDWAWEMAKDYEEKFLNTELKEDLLMEAIVIMHRR